jgi:hypothetical protein
MALAAKRFRRQYHRDLRIEPWRNRPCYPRELLPWEEGSTQVDLTIRWENPPTTVYVEMKYGSGVSTKTAGDNGHHGYPSDQLIRNVRVGLLECGWLQKGSMFELPPRDFILLLCYPGKGHPLVHEYRDTARVRAAIPHSERLMGLPVTPFIGELGYGDIVQVLRQQRCRFTRSERRLADSLADYLTYKVAMLPGLPPGRQGRIAFGE